MLSGFCYAVALAADSALAERQPPMSRPRVGPTSRPTRPLEMDKGRGPRTDRGEPRNACGRLPGQGGGGPCTPPDMNTIPGAADESPGWKIRRNRNGNRR